MRADSAPSRTVRRIARWPGVSRLALIAARASVGRHHVSAIAVVLDDGPDQDAVVLLARHVFRGDRWGLPGGWVRRREDPAAACGREVLEEVGVDVRAVDVLGCEVHAIDGTPLRYGGITLAFGCALVDPRAPELRPQSVELSDVGWFPVSQAVRLVTEFERAMIDHAIERMGR